MIATTTDIVAGFSAELFLYGSWVTIRNASSDISPSILSSIPTYLVPIGQTQLPAVSIVASAWFVNITTASVQSLGNDALRIWLVTFEYSQLRSNIRASPSPLILTIGQASSTLSTRCKASLSIVEISSHKFFRCV